MQLSLIDGLEFNVMRYEEIPLPTSNDKVNNGLKDYSKLKKSLCCQSCFAVRKILNGV